MQPTTDNPRGGRLFLVGPLTAEMFERFLDASPGRRTAHERRSPSRRRHEFERIARLAAIRASPFARSFAEVLAAVRALRGMLRALIDTYPDGFVADIVRAASLPVPDDRDDRSGWGWGEDSLDETLDHMRWLARRIDRFYSHEKGTADLLLPSAEGDGPLGDPKAA